MKPIYTLILALVTAATVTAAPVIKAKANGSWTSNSTWDLGRKPQSGDTIIIPVGFHVILSGTQSLNNVFIKISGILELSNGVLLLNAASRINVYTSGKIYGGGPGNGDQIKIGLVFKFNDSPQVTGPRYADNTTGAAPLGFSPLLLPVTFINFYLNKTNNEIHISWATANESNNNHFEIERSFDAGTWSVIAIVTAAGNTNSITNYTFTDKNMNADVAYYRIKQVDNDGRTTYTAIRSIKNNNAASTTEIFAGSNKNITIKFDVVKSNVSVKIWNLNGQSLMQQSYQHSAYISFRLNNALPGIYVVQVTDENNKSESQKIILN